MAEPVGGAVLAAYRTAGGLAAPVMPWFLAWRVKRGKEDPARLSERYGIAARPRPPGPLVWVHAASVGETNAVLPLVEKLVGLGPRVLLTTVTITSAAIAEKRLPEGAFHQFAPIDIAPWVGRFLGHWRPDLALFVESELWPVSIASLAAAGVPLVLVNARLSERTYRRWKMIGGSARRLFHRVPLCLAQGLPEAERYRDLGVERVVVTGNLKLNSPPPPADATALESLRAALGGRPVWVAASTHEGEEVAAGRAHAALKLRHQGLLTIIVPRHPERGAAIAEALGAEGLRTERRSVVGDAISSDCDVYVADTLGELGLFYRAAPVAFLGGSLVPHGGQNPIEAVRLQTAIVHGPHVENFAAVYEALDEKGRAAEVTSPESLGQVVDTLLSDPAEARQRASASSEALRPFSGALEATLKALSPYVDRLVAAASPASVSGR